VIGVRDVFSLTVMHICFWKDTYENLTLCSCEDIIEKTSTQFIRPQVCPSFKSNLSLEIPQYLVLLEVLIIVLMSF
jgi:hypothetical protein